MKKAYTLILFFYIIAFAIVFAFVKLSPDHGDGTPGLGSTALIFFMVLIALLVIINIIKGFTTGRSFFLVALLHALALFLIYFGLLYR
ncbi:hypothetical protein LL912_06680 [Niabella sp. CC-SYL272]|uniref:hypothetical protein n=1 Tax=Niabella agricola TaxID=2891571 RepID=UPI001F2C0E89|nr:hypothetical protein [Niabella agricola]MCF3108456.1 hypothetical protein [Niabella agricola]